ncbi:hypothetical protein YC2023_075028 [Brassica napus]
MGVLISSRRGTFPTVEINGLKARGAFVPDEGDLTVDCRAGSNLSRPRISEKETLARLRIRRARRFSNTRRPKLRILMLDSAVVLLASSQDCTPTFGKGGLSTCVISIPRDNLIDSWYQSLSFMPVVGVAPGDRVMPSRVAPGDQRDERTGRLRRPARREDMSPPATGSCLPGSPPATSATRGQVTPGDRLMHSQVTPWRPAWSEPGSPYQFRSILFRLS